MKIAAQMCCFRESRRVRQAMLQYNNIDFLFVTCSSKPWQGNLEPDDTYEIALETAKKMKIPVKVVKDYWETEEIQRNFMLDQMQEYDWVIVAPPDRFFTE